jgi:hypothetical protein
MAPGLAIPSRRAAILTPSPIVAIAFLDDVTKVDADAKLDPALGRQASIALDHPALNLDSAAHGRRRF